jgi:hypothetical protein
LRTVEGLLVLDSWLALTISTFDQWELVHLCRFRHTSHVCINMLLSNDSMDWIGDHIGAVYQGGWLSEIDCVIFCYLFSKLYVSQAGKSVGWIQAP